MGIFRTKILSIVFAVVVLTGIGMYSAPNADAKESQKNIIAIFDTVPDGLEYKDAVNILHINTIVLPELAFSESGKVLMTENLLQFINNIQQERIIPTVLLSMGRKTATVTFLLSLSNDDRKKKEFIAQLLRSIEVTNTQGVAFLFDKTFDDLTFGEKITLESLVKNIREAVAHVGKTVTGKGKQELRLVNDEQSTIWFVGQSNKENILPQTLPPSIPLSPFLLPSFPAIQSPTTNLNTISLNEETVMNSPVVQEAERRRHGDSPSPSPVTPPTDPIPPVDPTPPIPPPPALRLPVIFGFSKPSDVSAPGSSVESIITEQAKRGITEVPIYIGNVTQNGDNMSLSGVAPNLNNFMTMLDRIETTLKLAPNTLKVRPYIRGSVTAGDAAIYGNGPGKISLNNPTTRHNLINLIQQIASGQKYGLSGSRIEEVTMDLEAITASNYDLNDLSSGDEGSVTQMAAFLQELKPGLGKKLGIYCSGFLSDKWFPSETNTPIHGPFLISPQNYISEQDAELLFRSGADVIEIGGYSIFPKLGGSGGFADPAVYGPVYSSYAPMIKTYYEVLARIADRNSGLGLSSTKSIRIDIPVFSESNEATTAEAVSGLQEMISTGVTPSILGSTFDSGSLDEQEKALIFSAEQ